MRTPLKILFNFASLAVKWSRWAGRCIGDTPHSGRIVNHSSVNTSTTNASIKNRTNWVIFWGVVYYLRMALKKSIGFTSLAGKWTWWAGRCAAQWSHSNHHHDSSVNTSTTNASMKNRKNWGDSLRCSILSTNGIKKVNWFCIAGCEMIVMGWAVFFGDAPLWSQSKPPSRQFCEYLNNQCFN